MLKFYERRKQTGKTGARLSTTGSAKLTPFLSNDTSLCTAYGACVYGAVARGACNRFESFITLQRFTLPRIFTRPCVALKTSRTICFGSRLRFPFFANSWSTLVAGNLVCTQRHALLHRTFYTFFTLLYVFLLYIFANEMREQIKKV